MEKTLIALLALMFFISGCVGGNMEVKEGDIVKVHYTGKLESGNVFDSSEGRDPLEFKAGAGQMIKGFDAAVIGMEVGEKKTVEIEPEDAYGQSSDELIQVVNKDRVGDQEVKVGDTLTAFTPTGAPVTGVILEITEEGIKVDFNHELAGKKLIFDIELVDIKR
jgi:FKBP-type peptidyl-prolyl cis-trans isomerase 2